MSTSVQSSEHRLPKAFASDFLGPAGPQAGFARAPLPAGAVVPSCAGRPLGPLQQRRPLPDKSSMRVTRPTRGLGAPCPPASQRSSLRKALRPRRHGLQQRLQQQHTSSGAGHSQPPCAWPWLTAGPAAGPLPLVAEHRRCLQGVSRFAAPTPHQAVLAIPLKPAKVRPGTGRPRAARCCWPDHPAGPTLPLELTAHPLGHVQGCPEDTDGCLADSADSADPLQQPPVSYQSAQWALYTASIDEDFSPEGEELPAAADLVPPGSQAVAWDMHTPAEELDGALDTMLLFDSTRRCCASNLQLLLHLPHTMFTTLHATLLPCRG